MSYLKQSIGVIVNREEIYLRHAFLTKENQFEIKKSKTILNTPKEFWQAGICLENQIGNHPEVPTAVVLEAVGQYHQPIIHFLNEQGYSVYVILSKATNGEESPMGLKANKLELNTLVQKGLSGKLTQWDIPSESMRTLKGLSHELIQRKKDFRRASKQLKTKESKQQPIPNMIDRLKRYIVFLEKQIEEINHDFLKFIGQDEQLKGPISRMSQTYGLDKVMLATLVSESDGFVSHQQ
ncbi:MAG: hypothetical protein R3B93_10185 [Bacteroidia bacterium]